ncbi:hypothetical protein VTN77DRAFT_1924 [Rasamsonia byssochlamydoides]|uniref:uncharacterized protein n=1 Tax=Rasamsonia byssochlamydoides TaxID=89139 RepID=UPI003742C17B
MGFSNMINFSHSCPTSLHRFAMFSRTWVDADFVHAYSVVTSIWMLNDSITSRGADSRWSATVVYETPYHLRKTPCHLVAQEGSRSATCWIASWSASTLPLCAIRLRSERKSTDSSPSSWVIRMTTISCLVWRSRLFSSDRDASNLSWDASLSLMPSNSFAQVRPSSLPNSKESGSIVIGVFANKASSNFAWSAGPGFAAGPGMTLNRYPFHPGRHTIYLGCMLSLAPTWFLLGCLVQDRGPRTSPLRFH